MGFHSSVRVAFQSVAQNTGCFICVHGIISEGSCNGVESNSTVMVLEGIDSWLTAGEHGFNPTGECAPAGTHR